MPWNPAILNEQTYKCPSPTSWNTNEDENRTIVSSEAHAVMKARLCNLNKSSETMASWVMNNVTLDVDDKSEYLGVDRMYEVLEYMEKLSHIHNV